ncbi:hypothetical protein GHK86_14730 [Acidimicrobiaceae bacterium USS-CC1]|uniref:Uncharacterized protein n=1 Tax=Acidiferrimicrobium australe TaxID=2664430 RepID=A0ABW9QWZ6_9ACTN|nr:hypothetical protein [Acidiferrimicrobium australe]
MREFADEADDRGDGLRRSAPSRAVFDEKRNLVEIECQLSRRPWWVYALLVVHDDRLKLAEVRVFPSVERDAYYDVRDEVYGKWLAAGSKGQPPPMPPEDFQRLNDAKRHRPSYGQWRRTAANLEHVGSGIDKTLLGRIRPSELVEVAAAKSSYLERLVPGGNAAVSDVLAAAPVHGAKSDLYYAKLAREYVALVGTGSRRPLVEMAERRGGKDAGWTRDKMRDEIRQCRNRLLLPSMGEHSGRPGLPMLTDRARDLLAEEEAQS